MTDRTDGQAAINLLTAKQNIADSVTPTNLASDQLQVLLDKSLMVDEAGGLRTILDPLIFGNFNDFTVWNLLKGGKYRMTASKSQIFNSPPIYEQEYQGGAGIFYIFDIELQISTNFWLSMSLNSDQDTENINIGRVTRRTGTLINAGSGEPWTEYALLADTDRPQFVNAQSFANQVPTGLNVPLLIEAGPAQNVDGEVELLVNGTVKWNKAPVRTTIDISLQPGRVASPGTAKLILYAAINVTTDGATGADGDWFPFGRIFALVLDDADTEIPMQLTNHFLAVDSLPFSTRFYISRSVDGNDDGSLLAIPVGVGMDHFGNAFPQLNTASFGLSAWGT